MVPADVAVSCDVPSSTRVISGLRGGSQGCGGRSRRSPGPAGATERTRGGRGGGTGRESACAGGAVRVAPAVRAGLTGSTRAVLLRVHGRAQRGGAVTGDAGGAVRRGGAVAATADRVRLIPDRLVLPRLAGLV